MWCCASKSSSNSSSLQFWTKTEHITSHLICPLLLELDLKRKSSRELWTGSFIENCFYNFCIRLHCMTFVCSYLRLWVLMRGLECNIMVVILKECSVRMMDNLLFLILSCSLYQIYSFCCWQWIWFAVIYPKIKHIMK